MGRNHVKWIWDYKNRYLPGIATGGKGSEPNSYFSGPRRVVDCEKGSKRGQTIPSIDKLGVVTYDLHMARKLRIEYPGAIYLFWGKRVSARPAGASGQATWA